MRGYPRLRNNQSAATGSPASAASWPSTEAHLAAALAELGSLLAHADRKRLGRVQPESRGVAALLQINELRIYSLVTVTLATILPSRTRA